MNATEAEVDTKALLELIAEYWNLAYAEGKEGRNHDTPDGAAQRTLSAIEAALASLVREREELSWNTDLSAMPKDRKICVIWKDLYSDNDAGGPTFTTGHTFWNENHWANKPSSHWGPYAWCDFPGFQP